MDHVHLQPPGLRLVYLDVPGMGGNDLLADRQPKARPFVTSRSTTPKALEQPAQMIMRNPRPLIRNHESTGPYPQLNSPTRRAVLNGVFEKVLDEGKNGAPVSRPRAEVLLKHKSDLNI